MRMLDRGSESPSNGKTAASQPTSWTKRKFGQLAVFRNGLNFLRSDSGVSVKVIGVSDFQRHFRISYDQLDTVQVAGALGPDNYLQDGDLLFVRSNGNKALIGRCILIENLPEPICFSGFTIRARITDPQVLPVFAGIYFQSEKARSAIHQAGEGSQISNLSQGMLASVEVPTPPPAEQRAIAEALSDIDGLLGGLDRLIAKKRDLKQAAMQQLLTGQTRLPGFHGEWEVKAIGGEIDLLTGFPFPSSQYSESGVRLLRGSNVKRGETDWSEDLVQCWPKISPDLSHYELRDGDLVISMDGSLVGRSYARLSPQDLPALLLQRVARIRSESIDIGFLTQVIGSDRFVKYCDSVKTVTAIPHISSADI